MPTVSVVIPVFNGERFIAAAIQSVLDQTFQDFEIIVVDDGSVDQTQEIVRRFSGPIAYCRQENQGAAQARNLGVANSQGKWIAFLDADDVWYPEKLAVQSQYSEVYPETAFFYSDFDVINEEGCTTQKQFLNAKLDKRCDRMKLVSLAFDGGPTPHPSTALVGREAFLQLGGFNPLFRGNYYEDLEFFARVVRRFPHCFISQSLAKYRLCREEYRKASSTEEDNWLILLARLSEMWGDEPNKKSLVNWHLAKHCTQRGKQHLRSGDFREAQKYFRLAFSYRPLYWKNVRRLMLSYVPGAREFYLWRKKGKKPTFDNGRQLH